MLKGKIFILFIIIMYSSFGQTPKNWNLSECIEYALKENLSVQQTGLAVSQNALQYEQSKRNKLPTANGQANYGYNYGFSVNPTNNQVVSQGLTSGSVGVSSGLNLYSGLQVQNSILQNETNLSASTQDKEDAERNIALSVAQAYLQVIMAKEMLENSRVQVNSTKTQIERLRKMIEAGSMAESGKYTLEAQLATEELSITTMENQVELAMLSLRQSMNLQPDISLTIETPNLGNYEPTLETYSLKEIYKESEGSLPNIKSADLRVRSAMIGVELSKAPRKPTLSIYSQFNTRYSSIAMRQTDETIVVTQPIFFNGQTVDLGFPQNKFEKSPVFYQLVRNFGLAAGLNLSVPIYSRGQNLTNQQLAEINVKNAQLNAQIQRQSLRQAIERAAMDVKLAYSNYAASQKQLAAFRALLENTEKQLTFGVGNQVDFTLAKNNLNRIENDLIRLKYDFLFKTKILEFYQGKDLRL
jgi:outer membrane protein